MTIVSILEKILAEAGDMGDTEYMAKKSFDGKTVTVTADIDTMGSKLSHTVPAGMRFYFHTAKIVVTGHPAAARQTNENFPDAVEADLKIAGNVVDTTNIGVRTQAASTTGTGGAPAASGYGNLGDGKFDVKGRIAEAGQVIEIENIVDNGTATATLIGFEELTATDPTILAQSITVDANITGEATDIGFIQDRVLTGNYFHVLTDISNPANKATFTVPDGRTAFLIEAKITMITNPGASAGVDQVVATLQKNINAVITEFSKAKIGKASQTFTGVREIGGAGFGLGGYCPFNVKGFSLVGSGANNKIEIENTVDSGSAIAEFSGYLV